MENELKPCPECGEVPMIGYACGEYFILTPSKPVGTCDLSPDPRDMLLLTMNLRVMSSPAL